MPMLFERRFVIAAPLSRVAAFHSSAASLRAITPPLVPMRVEEAPDPLLPGKEMSFVMWMGPLPVRWRAGLEELPGLAASPGVAGFVDRQLEGPFSSWVHQHRFEAQGEDETIVHDRIQARLASPLRRPLAWAIGLSMWLGLAPLFAFRRWKTRRLLEDTT